MKIRAGAERWGSFPMHFCNAISRLVSSVVTALTLYRAEKKSWYVVARNFFLHLLNFSAWPCLGPA